MMRPARVRVWCEVARAEMWALWHSAVVTDRRLCEQGAELVLRGRERYEALERATGVPWWWTGAVHVMECGGDFGRHLHNGDALTGRTVRVPAGRPAAGRPPFGWEESAADALRLKGLEGVREWSVERALWEAERYNGLGYRLYRGMASPYVWAGTNHYTRGKYVRDGVWDGDAVSRQAGVAGMWLVMGVARKEGAR